MLKLEAGGTKPRWSIEDVESHKVCDLAWATWTNRGTFNTAARAVPNTWLESAGLVWREGAWKIRVCHSTPGVDEMQGERRELEILQNEVQ